MNRAMVRILIIEDDREIRANLGRFLRLEGHETREADRGDTGLALAADADLVLCDVMMPGLDGFGVLERLRAGPSTRGLPFVFVTASAEREVLERASARGADGVLIKPFDLAGLRETIARALAGRD